MADRGSLALLTDEALGVALRDLATFVAVPEAGRSGGPDPALRAPIRVQDGGGRAGRRWRLPVRVPRLGRGVVLALVALAVLAAVAGAIGLGLPGIRIVAAPSSPPAATFTGPTAIPSPSAPRATPRATASGPLGFDLGLGDPVAVADAARSVDFPIVLPAADAIGPPTTAWLLDGRLSLVWRTSASLPETETPGVGLLLDQFRGSVNEGYFQKVIDQGTTVTTVQVGGRAGYWISGAPHEIIYVNPNGQVEFDSRRSVGDTLLWVRGDITYRLESGLGRDASIALAESLR
jgi:hypothetical protein